MHRSTHLIPIDVVYGDQLKGIHEFVAFQTSANFCSAVWSRCRMRDCTVTGYAEITLEVCEPNSE